VRIVFFGEDSFSAVVLQSIIDGGYNVILTATPYYNNFVYKRLEIISSKFDIPFSRIDEINSNFFITKIKEINPDVIVTAHFKKLLGKDLIRIPQICCLNLHPSILPSYRGMAPQHWPIIFGDVETGVTLHFIEEGIDTGNILVQKKIQIPKDIYVHDLQILMLPLYKTVVVEGLKLLESGDRTGTKQELSKGSFFGKFKSESARITLDKGVNNAYNLIRAISKPYMGAFFGNYRIWKAIPLDENAKDKISRRFREKGLHFDKDNRAYLIFEDGILLINSFEQMN
jgi:methionyl-tRNA formyltransferase